MVKSVRQMTLIQRIPDEYCIPNDDQGIAQLIKFIYDDDTLQHPSAAKLQDKAIICPKNDMADTINAKILSLLSTTTRVYISHNDAVPHGTMAATGDPNRMAEAKGKMIAIEQDVTTVTDLRPTHYNRTIE
ncbi:DNA helicase, partial [Tanacetum coccineum]